MPLTALAITAAIAGILKGLRNWFYLTHILLVAIAAYLLEGATGYQHPFSAPAITYVLILHIIFINAITIFIYVYDKRQARKGGWRVSERSLHSFAFAGGSLGALFAQKWFRHKTRKKRFKQAFWAGMFFQSVLLLYIIHTLYWEFR